MKLWQRKSLQVVALVGLWHLPGVAFKKGKWQTEKDPTNGEKGVREKYAKD